MTQESTDILFAVVVNHEEQYSIWYADRPLPQGWSAVGFTGSREACLDRIAEIWTDMRPRSLREYMQSQTPSAQ